MSQISLFPARENTSEIGPENVAVLQIYKHLVVSTWCESVLGYLFADIICSEKRTVFRGLSSRKTASFEEQIMYPRIFPRFSWEIFGHVTRLDQSCASENI